MQMPFAGQSMLNTHCPPAAALGWQNPAWHTSPVPQSAPLVQLASH
jgi:hypothetical protein